MYLGSMYCPFVQVISRHLPPTLQLYQKQIDSFQAGHDESKLMTKSHFSRSPESMSHGGSLPIYVVQYYVPGDAIGT